MAEIVTKLLAEKCRNETAAAVKYEGDKSLEEAFGLLGRVAMSGIMTDDKVNKALGRYSQYIDEEEIEAIFDD